MIEIFHFSCHLSLNYGHTKMKTDEDIASLLTTLLKTSPFVEMKQLADLIKIHNIESHKERAFK